LADRTESSLYRLGPVNLGPGARYAYPLNAASENLDEPLVVRASAPVFVESDSYALSARGISLSFGVPLTP
jgi:hypothetical protein